MIFDPKVLQKYRFLYLQLRTISNPKRYLIFNIIERSERIHVGKIVEISDMDQPVVSQLISVLRKANFVNSFQEKKNVYYEINKIEIDKVIRLGQILIGESKQDAPVQIMNNYAKVHSAYLYLKALLNKGRLTCLEAINQRGEASVNEISKATQMNQSMVSQNLSILKSLKIVKSRRDGKNTRYTIIRDRIQELITLV